MVRMGPSFVDDLWDFDDPTGSEQRFRSAAAVALTQAARALGLLERYDEGHAVLDAIESDDAEVGVRVLLERGRLLRSAGAPTAEPFEHAAAAAGAAGLQELRVDALHMLAMLPEAPAEQIAANQAALAEAGGTKWEASLLNNLGCAQVDAEDLPAALATFERALAVREARGEERPIQIARWMVGWTLRLLGRTDEALAIQTALKAEVGDTDPYVDEELALLQGG
ncbi:MAG: hypothetical protein QOF76_1708 [Solirubrobacteraceae bacterium]|jgi:tetratricopeptide (TPR) repeat protein|nr:hypothetical protein [Solirubrobacteraceae bacterium]